MKKRDLFLVHWAPHKDRCKKQHKSNIILYLIKLCSFFALIEGRSFISGSSLSDQTRLVMIVDPQGRFPIRLAIIICNQKVNAKLTIKLYKRLDPSDKASYRHVSILSLVSKVFEKICMIKFMHTLNIFSNKFLCGFPKVHSTEHALFRLIQQ